MDNTIFSIAFIKNNILPLYNLYDSEISLVKFKDTDKQRAVYKINHNNTLYCLKKVYFELDELLFVYSALEWLYKSGFIVPSLISSIYGEKYIKINNNYFILMPWLSGEKCNFDNENHIKLSAMSLGKMHFLSKNFNPILDTKKRIQSFNHYISTLKHFEELLIIYAVSNRSNDEFSKVYLENFTTHLKLAEISLKLSSMIKEDELTVSLCHGDYVNKNILIHQGNVAVIDFDKCKLGFIASDIGYFLRRCLKRDNTCWNYNIYEIFLKNYTSMYKLNQSDMYYILSYLAFPQKFWKISRDYYFGKNKNTESFNIIKKVNKKSLSHLEFISSLL